MRENQKISKEQNLAVHVSIVSIVVNFILSAGKLLAGIVGKSNAMISDAVHSASDVLSTIVVIVGVKMAEKRLTRNILMVMSEWNVSLLFFWPCCLEL